MLTYLAFVTVIFLDGFTQGVDCYGIFRCRFGFWLSFRVNAAWYGFISFCRFAGQRGIGHARWNNMGFKQCTLFFVHFR